MKAYPSCIILLASLVGCASPATGYYSTYQVDGSKELSGKAAEQTFLGATAATEANSPAARSFDLPLKLISAPQPVMSREDTDQHVVGSVVVAVQFNEAGAVERTSILSSSKDSLSQAVLAAVSQWRIAPATRDGKPQKVTVRQSFGFKTAP